MARAARLAGVGHRAARELRADADVPLDILFGKTRQPARRVSDDRDVDSVGRAELLVKVVGEGELCAAGALEQAARKGAAHQVRKKPVIEVGRMSCFICMGSPGAREGAL